MDCHSVPPLDPEIYLSFIHPVYAKGAIIFGKVHLLD